jgi:ABC-type amino acid transport substrate-binding protein
MQGQPQPKRLALAALALILLGWAGPSVAQQRDLRIGIVDDQLPCSDVDNRLFRGSVIKMYRGSAVDIWHQVANRANLRYRFVPLERPNTAIRAAAEDRVDLAVTCFNITPHRLQEVFFTTPYSDDGLSLLTKRQPKSFGTILNNLRSSPLIRDSTSLLFLIGLAFAAILWITSREFQHRDIVGDNKKHTFYKGWMMLAMGTGIYKMGSAPLSMSIIALNNFIRLVITSIFVAATTSVVLEASAPVDITDSTILKAALQQKIGVDQDTAAQAWLEKAADSLLSVKDQLRLIIPFDHSDDLINALNTGKVGSILADSATIALLRKKLDNPKDYEVLGQTFYRTPQAFATSSKLDDKTYHAINVALAELKFEGEVDSILKRWQPPNSR